MSSTYKGRYDSMLKVINSSILAPRVKVHAILDSRNLDDSVYKFSLSVGGLPNVVFDKAFKGTILENAPAPGVVFHTQDRDLTPAELVGALVSRIGDELLNEEGVRLKRIFEDTKYPHP